MSRVGMAAPALDASAWLNAAGPIPLESLRGKVVLIEAFQMLCPGCVSHGLPQAQRVADTFGPRVQVIGLHTVFEHHEAQGSASALGAFLHEYRIGFPVAIDRPVAGSHLPATMSRYGMQGTPTLILIDQAGVLRRQSFGHVPDLILGADIGLLLTGAPAPATDGEDLDPAGCTDQGCAVQTQNRD